MAASLPNRRNELPEGDAFFDRPDYTLKGATGWPPRGTKTLRYRRISSKSKPRTGHGLNDQLEYLQGVEAEHGFDCVGDESETYSGTFMQRPGLKRILERLEAGEAKYVLMRDVDRLSRAEDA